MRIDGSYRAPLSARSGGASARVASSAFSLDGETEQVRSGSTASAGASTAISSLLALQEVDDPLLAKKKALRRGRALLDVLESIRLDLISGEVGEGRLNALLALVTQARERSEPELDLLLDDIELRARVELAKLGRVVAG